MSDSVKTSIAVVGDKDTALAFKALGINVFYANEASEIRKVLKDLVNEQYAIILITEKHARLVNDYLKNRAEFAYPIILPIPDGITNTGYGLERIEKNIEIAIGSTAGGLLK